MGSRNDQLKKQKAVARERIVRLFELAEEKFLDGRKDLANRYVYLARKIAMKLNVSIPSSLRRRFCRHCYHFLQPGINLRVRTKGSKVVYYCLDCKEHMRFPYLREKKSVKKV